MKPIAYHKLDRYSFETYNQPSAQKKQRVKLVRSEKNERKSKQEPRSMPLSLLIMKHHIDSIKTLLITRRALTLGLREYLHGQNPWYNKMLADAKC